MANPEHVELVRRGRDALAEWRRANPAVRLDLSGANLARANLGRANLRQADLSGADLSRANLTEATLQGANCITANLDGSNLTGADLAEADLSNASLRQAVLITANLARANLTRANLARADLLRADLIACDLTGASLRRADLAEADLAGAELHGADFHRANLAGANLVHAHLGAANLFRANLTQANLFEVDLARVTCAFTTWAHCDLSRCRGLDTVEHPYPSDIGLSTLARTLRGAGGGFAPEQRAFFLGAGVPEALLEALPRLVREKPLQFYNCYVYSAPPDEAFAGRLAEGLAAQGLPCWSYEEAAIVGQARGANVERTLPVYDKVIVVCSRAGLSHSPLLREVQRALQKEDRLRSQGAADAEVLIPVRRDDYLLDGWRHPLKAAVVAKHVGDFRDPARYAEELQYLIAALSS